MLTFRQFLYGARRRDDPVGDAAREFFDDPGMKGLSSPKSILNRLSDIGASTSFQESYRQAATEWSKLTGACGVDYNDLSRRL